MTSFISLLLHTCRAKALQVLNYNERAAAKLAETANARACERIGRK